MIAGVGTVSVPVFPVVCSSLLSEGGVGVGVGVFSFGVVVAVDGGGVTADVAVCSDVGVVAGASAAAVVMVASVAALVGAGVVRALVIDGFFVCSVVPVSDTGSSAVKAFAVEYEKVPFGPRIPSCWRCLASELFGVSASCCLRVLVAEGREQVDPPSLSSDL